MSPRESAMEDEFDVVAGWTMSAIRELGPDHALPAACRGTSNPAMLSWLIEACGLMPGEVLLDVGGGMGGPAAYAARRVGIRPLVIDPMPLACRAAKELFGIPSVVASGNRLPVANDRVDAVWCLGVLCSTTDKATTLRQMRRIIRTGGLLGLMVLTANEPNPPGSPKGNAFPRHDELAPLLWGAGFDLTDETRSADLEEAPRAWTQRLHDVKNLVRTKHSDDPRMSVADDQETRMATLFDAGHVESRLLCARAT